MFLPAWFVLALLGCKLGEFVAEEPAEFVCSATGAGTTVSIVIVVGDPSCAEVV